MFERSRTGAVDVIRGQDPINLQNVRNLGDHLDACLSVGQPHVVLDLEKVPLIDSAGLELLLDFQDRCAERAGIMKLAAPTPLCRDILNVTGVATRFDIYQDSLAAIGSFAQ